MMFARPTISLYVTALFVIASCSDNGPPSRPLNEADIRLINGYVLSGYETRYFDGRSSTSTVVDCDFLDHVCEWSYFDSNKSVIHREVTRHDAIGRILRSENYHDTGALAYSYDYTIIEGQITERVETTPGGAFAGRMSFSYTEDGRIQEWFHIGVSSFSLAGVGFNYDESINVATEYRTIWFDWPGLTVDYYLEHQFESGRLSTSNVTEYISPLGPAEPMPNDGVISRDYIYDEFGNNTVTYGADKLGNPVSVTTYTYLPVENHFINFRLRELSMFLNAGDLISPYQYAYPIL